MHWNELSTEEAFCMMSDGYVLATGIEPYYWDKDTGTPTPTDVEILQEGCGLVDCEIVEVAVYIFLVYN